MTGAYLQYQEHDFRCNPEDPPLWKYYVVVGSGTRLPMDHTSKNWDEMLQKPAQFIFASDALYHTPGEDADGLLRGATVDDPARRGVGCSNHMVGLAIGRRMVGGGGGYALLPRP